MTTYGFHSYHDKYQFSHVSSLHINNSVFLTESPVACLKGCPKELRGRKPKNASHLQSPNIRFVQAFPKWCLTFSPHYQCTGTRSDAPETTFSSGYASLAHLSYTHQLFFFLLSLVPTLHQPRIRFVAPT
jgi:hypothetical protein